MLNHITIMGRLTRNPELRRTGNNIPVAAFTVAVDRDYGPRGDRQNRETDYIDCVAWRHTGEFVSKYFSKGSMIVVSGRLQIRDWTDKDGNKRRIAEVVAENVYFGESKRTGEQRQSPPPAFNGAAMSDYGIPEANYGPPGTGYTGYTPPVNPVSDFAMLEGDDSELPF